jgi:hypothetical protein
MPPVFGDRAWERLLDGAPRLQPTTANTESLSEHPLDHAVLAIGDPQDDSEVLVLGEDATWRRVDEVDLVPVRDESGYESPVLRPTSLSPDATRLALPQPGGLVVVDLSTGDTATIDVGGPANTYAVWVDETHVFVAEETAPTGSVVDLGTGEAAASRSGPSTAYLPDGSAVTWQGLGLTWDDGSTVPTGTSNDAGNFPSPPLVAADIVVGLDGYDYRHAESPTNRIAVVDRTTGAALAFLPLSTGNGEPTELLGWDGDRVLVGLVNPNLSAQHTAVVAWDWEHQQLEPVAVVPGWAVSWGQGWSGSVAND